ncbi:MAG: DNA repair exonuclease [Spirochaetales bacterium]|nr:DNA repair exonuclease [Spirochaetales bacterium]
MEFIHTADWHLDNPFSSFDPETRAKLNEARYESVQMIFEYARKESIPLVLCAGDQLDDGQFAEKGVLFKLLELVSGYPDIRVVMITGNHDPNLSGTVYSRVENRLFPANLLFINEKRVLTMEDLDARIFAAPLSRKNGTVNPLTFIRAGEMKGGLINIGLGHGSVAIAPGKYSPDDFPIEPGFAQSAGLDYLALGHFHSFLKIDDRTYYPGTHEKLTFDDNCGVLRVRIEGKGSLPRVENVAEKTSLFSWKTRNLVLTGSSLESFKQEMEGAKPDNVVRKIILSGMLDVEQYNFYHDILERFKDNRDMIEDRVRINPDEESILNLTDGFMTGVVKRLLELKSQGNDIRTFPGLEEFSDDINAEEIIDRALLDVFEFYREREGT